MQALFPTLPPEIRNLIYHYCSDDIHNPATTLCLPLSPKTLSTKHTVITLQPVHTGNLNLLTLTSSNILEAHEYRSYLLANNIQLRVGIHIKGNLRTFTQEHWDAQISKSLKKWVEKNPWLRRVATWNIRVLLDADMDSLSGAKGRGRVGRMVDGMVKTLLAIQDPRVAERRGDVRVRLHVPFGFVMAKRLEALEFGLERFLEGRATLGWREVREVTTGRGLRSQEGEKVTEVLRKVPGVKDGIDIVRVRDGLVGWGGVVEGAVVMRRRAEGTKVHREVGVKDEKGGAACVLRMECAMFE